MASFYGCGGSSSSSSSSAIKNIVGTNDTITILSGLDNGIYTIKGKYENSPKDAETNEFLAATEVSVFTDGTTGKKTATFNYVDNGNLYIKLIAFEDDESYTETDTKVGEVGSVTTYDCVWNKI